MPPPPSPPPQHDTKVVQEIQTQTKERKERLQPLIVKMRQMRTDVAELEQEHGRKKAVYEATAGSLGGEKSKLEAEVKTLQEECTLQESQMHVVQAQMQMTGMQVLCVRVCVCVRVCI